ncbi:pentapeptide repeat-containing protein, partial [Saccharopolyspora shandongensis]|uniref:pentapeptide repeat-containing protein n=1 Tax=Saccharopolyspora shandongensis TaxID=418495 RepID=UPI00341BB390
MTKSSTDSGSNTRLSPSWPTCDVVGLDDEARCTGVQVDGFGQCLAHLAPEQLDEALSRLRQANDIDFRGTPVSPELLARILDAVRDDDGHPKFGGGALFGGAKFSGGALFGGVKFGGEAQFIGATFS